MVHSRCKQAETLCVLDLLVAAVVMNQGLVSYVNPDQIFPLHLAHALTHVYVWTHEDISEKNKYYNFKLTIQTELKIYEKEENIQNFY